MPFTNKSAAFYKFLMKFLLHLFILSYKSVRLAHYENEFHDVLNEIYAVNKETKMNGKAQQK